jgi:hypothetical protein
MRFLSLYKKKAEQTQFTNVAVLPNGHLRMGKLAILDVLFL